MTSAEDEISCDDALGECTRGLPDGTLYGVGVRYLFCPCGCNDLFSYDQYWTW